MLLAFFLVGTLFGLVKLLRGLNGGSPFWLRSWNPRHTRESCTPRPDPLDPLDPRNEAGAGPAAEVMGQTGPVAPGLCGLAKGATDEARERRRDRACPRVADGVRPLDGRVERKAVCRWFQGKRIEGFGGCKVGGSQASIRFQKGFWSF